MRSTRTGAPWECELGSLAVRLIDNPNLRAEVASRVGIRSIGEPSPAYKEWKHRANLLAKDADILPAQQVELVIRRAIQITNRKAS